MNPNKTRGATQLRLCVTIVLFVVSSASHAATINNLYNTGVNNAGQWPSGRTCSIRTTSSPFRPAAPRRPGR